MSDIDKKKLEQIIRQAVYDGVCEAKPSFKQDIEAYNKEQLKKEAQNQINMYWDSIDLRIQNAVKQAMKEEVQPLKDIVYKTAMEIRFVKWLGYSFASIVAFVGWDKFASTIRSLFS